MKKLSLEMPRLTSNEVLHRSQMKKISGGYGLTCVIQCTNMPETTPIATCDRTTAETYCGSTSNVIRCNCY